MGFSKAPRIVIAGAGVFGLALALGLGKRGFGVTVCDPRPRGPNASFVAAGILGPIGEAIFDLQARDQLPFLSCAYGLWSAFAEDTGIELVRGDTVVPASLADALGAVGAEVSMTDGGVAYTGDARVSDPAGAMLQLSKRAAAAGVVFDPREVVAAEAGAITVLAAGPGSAKLIDLAPELARLAPIKGQLAVLPTGPTTGPVHRWPGGYLVPQPGGARAGATMEPGRADTEIEPEVIQRLARAAAERVPGLNLSQAYGLAGVRMATPDNLPLVGPSRTPGVLLATGARRNGWLLAPLVAQIIAAYVMGEDPGSWAATLHPGRFAKS